ncbi:MAG: hypothetical protein M3M99_05515 [Actinomycetota bacterium]|nr:hypothetical protein [Actinomycetota bacterium]
MPNKGTRRSTTRESIKREPTAKELRQVQDERATGEHEAIDQSATPDEAEQHKRRAAKSAYLARKLAERERSEREAQDR